MQPPTENQATIDWRQSAKDLAKALAKAGASAVVVGALLIGGFTVINLAFSIVFFFVSGLTGGGHGSLIALPLALLPFAPFVVFAFLLAQKQGVMRLVAAAVESQAPTLSALGSHYLGSYLEQRHGELLATKVGRGFDQGWQRYLKTRTESPRPVRAVLAQITARVPLGEIVDQLASENTPPERVPKELMKRVISQVASDRLRPSWTPVLILLAVNVVWLPFVIWAMDALSKR